VRRIVQIDAEIVGQHELHPAHHVLRARQLAQVHEPAAGGDRTPVHAAGIERPRLLRPVGQDLEPLLGDHAGAAGDGVAGAPADQVRRQVPVGVERGIADQARHFRRRHVAFADDDAHLVADHAVLHHPEPCRGGVDQDVASRRRGNGAGALDIGEDQPLVESGAPVERGDCGGIGAAGDRQAVNLLEGAEHRGGIGIGGETETAAHLRGPVCGDLDPGQARPAGAVGGESADEPVIGRIARQGGTGVTDGRRRGREGIEDGAVPLLRRGETGIDITHRVALRRAGAVAHRVHISLAQHHVGPESVVAVPGADRAERDAEVRAVGQQCQQGLVRAVRPDRLEVALGIEGQEVRARLECGKPGLRGRRRARGHGLGRVAVGRDGPEADGEAGGTQEAGQGGHGSRK
jgi:hypothetical protein